MKTSPMMVIWWKEVRGALPVWAALMALIWLPTLLGVRHTLSHDLQFVSLLIGSLLLAATVYARDFQDRTMMWQLLQPVSRMSPLWRKAALLLMLLAALDASYLFLLRTSAEEQLIMTGLLMLLALASGCFWSLLLRNILAVTVVSVSVPIILFVLLVPLIDLAMAHAGRMIEDPLSPLRIYLPGIFLGGFVVLYSLVTGAWAIRLWRRLQLPGEMAAASPLDVKIISCLTGDTVFRARAWWWALVRKEAGLLRFVIWVAAILVAGGGVYLIAGRLLDHMFDGSGVHSIGSLFWWHHNLHTWGRVLFSFHLALVPALCGALAFCEETHCGNRAWQLCQPAHRTGQWLIKLGVAAGFSAGVGLVLPLVVYLVAAPANAADLGREVLIQAVTLHVLLFSLSVWCASASRSSVMALMKTLLLVFGLYLVSQNVLDQYRLFAYSPFDWRLLAWPLSAIALAYTWPNFRRIEVPALRWVLQLAGMVLLSFGFACGVALW